MDTHIVITPFYASIMALFFVALSVRTLLLRRKLKIGIGTGDNDIMLRAMRVHSNFAEYVPITLLLALIIELMEGHWVILHAICLLLFIGRISHACGVSQTNENYRFRVMGMGLTFTSICISALILLYKTLLV